MKVLEVEKIVREDITPKYELSRDSHIDYVIEMLNKKEAMVAEYRETKDKELYKAIYGEYVELGRHIGEYRGGLKYDLPQEVSKLIFDTQASEDKIKAFYGKKFTKIINKVVDAVSKDLTKFNPNTIEATESEHDFNYILNSERSYTINTIVAGGNIQCIHNRTLRKLHKGVA